MKLLIVSVLLAAASAKPSVTALSVLYSSPVAVATPLTISSPVSSQYHAQDELGQYSYGYSNEHSSKAEARSIDGLTIGGYTYIDPVGKLQTVEYSSDANGFKVAASNLPVPPAVPVAPALPLPAPVEDTPEVAEARAKHLEAVEAAKVQLAEVAASFPAISTVVKSVSPVIAAGAAPLLAAPVLPAISVANPVASRISETSSEPTPATPSTETPASIPAGSESSSPSAVSAEAKSAGSPVAPAGVSIWSAPAPAIGVRSFAAPGLPIGVAPIVQVPTAYSINSLYPFYGFSSLVAQQPGVTTYTAQILVPAGNATWAPANQAEQRSE